jgi:hypothetical protein
MMEGQGHATVNMSPQAAGMLERLMLAQAQECCFERALAGGTSAASCSKVARQVRLAALCCLCCPVAMRCDSTIHNFAISSIHMKLFIISR